MTRTRIEELLAREEPRIRTRFRQVMERLRGERGDSEEARRARGAAIRRIEQALVDGKLAEVIGDVEAAAQATSVAVEGARLSVAHEVADRLSQSLDKVVSFDQSDPRAVEVLRQNRIRLVAGITEPQREVILDVLMRGTQAGTNPREMARDIRDTLGLTRKQAEAVAAYRAALETPTPLNPDEPPDPEAPTKPAKPALTPEQIDRRVEKYADQQLAARAESIARTEAKAAVHEGQEQAYQQAIDRGVLEEDSLEQTWHSGKPPRTRLWHASMNQQKRKWGEAFVSGLGNLLRFPGDPQAPAVERKQCRCGKSVRVIRKASTVAKGAPMRIMIAGWSGTGKTTKARAMGEDFVEIDKYLALEPFASMSNSERWSAVSAHVAELLAGLSSFTAEGVAVPRVLRKMLAAAPTVKPCDRLIVLTKARRPQTDGQVRQGKGHDTILDGILPALIALGVRVEVEPLA